jgi:hypothetical protein
MGDNFLERFKGQIQTLGKEGILGTMNNNEICDKKETIIFHNNLQSHKVNNLKPIKKGKPLLKPIEKTNNNEKQKNSTQEPKILVENNPKEEINEINQNKPILNNPYINNNPQYLIPNPFIPHYNYPLYQMNSNYPQPIMINPYYNNPYQQNQFPLINNNNNINNMINNLNNNQIIQNDTSNISNINSTINTVKSNGKAKLRPISANQSNISNISSSRLNSAYSRSRISAIEYEPYTLKEYKELEKVGVVLGGLGPNIGTKEWEEKKKKMQKMEEYSKKVSSMKKRTKSKEKFENILEEEKKKKFENSIRRRCYEYGNLIRPHPRSANIFGRRKNNNNNNNNKKIDRNNIPIMINNNNKFELDCSNRNNNSIEAKEKKNCDEQLNLEKPIFSLRNLNNAYINQNNIKRYDVGKYQNKFKDFEEKENEKNKQNNKNINENIMLNKNDFIGQPNEFYEENSNNEEEKEENNEINSDNIEKLLEVRQQYLKNIDMIKKLYQ